MQVDTLVAVLMVVAARDTTQLLELGIHPHLEGLLDILHQLVGQQVIPQHPVEYPGILQHMEVGLDILQHQVATHQHLDILQQPVATHQLLAILQLMELLVDILQPMEVRVAILQLLEALLIQV